MKTFFSSRERLESVRAELAAEAGLLEAAEGRPVADRAFEFTERVPASTARATRNARPTSRVQIEPESP